MSGLNDDELTELRKTFDSCDLNGDGFISPEEFHALLIKLDGDVSREECLLDFDVADTEGDGYIGFKEVVACGRSEGPSTGHRGVAHVKLDRALGG